MVAPLYVEYVRCHQLHQLITMLHGGGCYARRRDLIHAVLQEVHG